jgi:tetratricopeptide (TPR) repeat protein
VCDFTERLGESARLIEDAAAQAPAELPASVQARLDNWLGVVRARQERLPEAQALLTAAIARADALDDHATATGSRLMLGGVLRRQGLVAEGRAVLDRAIDDCARAGDHFHLAIGLFNRVNAWRQLDRPREAEADAERAIGVANRMGLDQVELWAGTICRSCASGSAISRARWRPARRRTRSAASASARRRRWSRRCGTRSSWPRRASCRRRGASWPTCASMTSATTRSSR